MNMKLKISKMIVLLVCLFTMLFAVQSSVLAFPTRPINVIAPQPPGGGTDLLARAFAVALSEYVDVPVRVNTLPGEAGMRGMAHALNQPPDGHNIVIGMADSSAIIPTLLLDVPPHDILDFTVVGINAEVDWAVSVHANAEWDTLSEFVEYARANPGLVVGTAGIGSSSHISWLSLMKTTGIDLVLVPYSGAAPMIAAVAGGHVEANTNTVASIAPAVDAGQLKVLAVSARERSKVFPDVPTATEQGIDYFFSTTRLVLIHGETPQPIVEWWEDMLKTLAECPKYIELAERIGQPAIFIGTEEATKYVHELREVCVEVANEIRGQ